MLFASRHGEGRCVGAGSNGAAPWPRKPPTAVIHNLAARFRNQLIAAANGQKHSEPICGRQATSRPFYHSLYREPTMLLQAYLYLAFSKPGIPFGVGEWLLWGLTISTVVGCVVMSAYKMLSIT